MNIKQLFLLLIASIPNLFIAFHLIPIIYMDGYFLYITYFFVSIYFLLDGHLLLFKIYDYIHIKESIFRFIYILLVIFFHINLFSSCILTWSLFIKFL